MRVFAAFLAAMLPAFAVAQTVPRNVHDCTRLTDPTALRDCVLRFEGARPMPPRVLPPEIEPPTPRAEPRRPPVAARTGPRPTAPPLRGTISEVPEVATTGSVRPRPPAPSTEPAARGRLP